MTIVNLVTPKAGAKHERLFNKPASGASAEAWNTLTSRKFWTLLEKVSEVCIVSVHFWSNNQYNLEKSFNNSMQFAGVTQTEIVN